MNILFLCTGNSARSILGEVIFNDLFSEHGHAYSAGSRPAGYVHPATLMVLENHGHKTHGLYSKGVNVFTGKDAPAINLIISVCDSAAQDCPVWPGTGNPQRLHWSLPDPSAVQYGLEKTAAFEKTYNDLKERITSLVA